MQILLMCAHEYGSVSFPVQWVDGHHVPERRYEIRDHQVVLDNGLAEPILHHDAEELLRNPLYRMPTPQEQEAFVKVSQQTTRIQEAFAKGQEEARMLLAEGDENEQAVAPATEDLKSELEVEAAPDAPPAVQKRKYTRKK